MPTEPLKHILDRDMSKVLGSNTIQLAAPLLRELVNDATNVFTRWLDSSKGEEDEDVPVLLSYLHIIEMTDAIEPLVLEACTNPIIPCLRSSFEALLAIKYILQSDYKTRSAAYMVGHVHRRMEMYELFDSDTPRGSDFQADWEADEARGKMEEYNHTAIKQHAKKSILNLQNLLKKKTYIQAEQEYQKVKQLLHRKPEWYQLFGGPPNLRVLAERLNYRARYDLLYRSWSNIAHAVDISRFITKTQDGKGAIKPLRNIDELATVAGFAAWVMLEAKTLVLNKFHPGEESSVKKWYLSEIRQRYLGLYGHKV